MRFMLMMKSNAKVEAGAPPSAELLAAMGKLNDEMAREGVLLGGEGLAPSAKGIRVRMSGDRFTIVDGPFPGSEALVAGYWLIQAPSKDEAIAWAQRVPGATDAEQEIEVRTLYEMGDLPVDAAEQPDGWREKEQQFRDAPAPPARKRGATRYLFMLKSDALAESGTPPDPKIMAVMGDLMDELVKAGALLGGEGLKPTATGARVRGAAGKRRVTDGPFTETKEMIAGYLMAQLATREEAIALAKRWLVIHVAAPGLTAGEIEIREML
jgi:hypothetical protein